MLVAQTASQISASSLCIVFNRHRKSRARDRLIRLMVFGAIVRHDFMKGFNMAIQTKIVDASGQISIGKQYAGQHVIMEEIEPGEWRIQTAITVPRSQAWAHSKAMQTELDQALDWAAKRAPKQTKMTSLAKKLEITSGRRK